MDRRNFLTKTAIGAGAIAAAKAGATAGQAESQKRPTHSAYGAWIAYMMNIKRVDSNKLAKKAVVERHVIDSLIKGELSPDDAREHVAKIGEILLSGNPKVQMERVLKALEVHTDLRN